MVQMTIVKTKETSKFNTSEILIITAVNHKQ